MEEVIFPTDKRVTHFTVGRSDDFGVEVSAIWLSFNALCTLCMGAHKRRRMVMTMSGRFPSYVWVPVAR